MHTCTCMHKHAHTHTHTHTHTRAHSVLSEADTLASRSQTPGLLDDSFVSVSNSEDRSALLQMLEEASCSSSDEGSEEDEIGKGGSKGVGERGKKGGGRREKKG